MTDAYASFMECPELQPIPNKDRISIVTIGGYDVIVRNDQFKKGDIGLFIAVDSILPQEMTDFYQLKLKRNRVKTMKLSGVYSQGLFLPIDGYVREKLTRDGFMVYIQYANVADDLGITKWKPEVRLSANGDKFTRQKNWPDPRIEYYDIESIQRPDFANVFTHDDSVVVTEKIHGMNGTFTKIGDKIYVMSRRVCFERDRPAIMASEDIANQTNAFYHIFDKYEIEKKMMESGYENLVLRFELFGKGIQNLDYGLSGVDFRLFDISIELGKYVDFYQFCTIAEQLQLPIVPILTIGNFDRESIYGLAERNSVIYPEQVSEGVVIRSIEEHPAPNIPRKILKLVSKRFAVKDTEGEKLDE